LPARPTLERAERFSIQTSMFLAGSTRMLDYSLLRRDPDGRLRSRSLCTFRSPDV